MNDYSIPPLLSSFVFLGCSFYLCFLKRFSSEGRAFLLLCLFTFGWQFSWFVLFNFPSLAPLLIKVGYSSIIFIPVAYYHFISKILWGNARNHLISLCYFVSSCFLVALWFTPYFIDGYYTYFWGPYPRASFLHPIYLIFLTVLDLAIILAILKQMPDSHPLKRSQLKYLLASVFIYTFAASDFLVNYGFEFYPPGFLAILGSILILFYAVATKNLLDAPLILKKSLLAGILLILWFLPAMGMVRLTTVFSGFFLKTFLCTVVAVVFSSLIGRIKLRTELSLDQFLNKDRYQYRRALKQISESLVSKLNLQQLMYSLACTFSSTLEVKTVALTLLDHDKLKVVSSKNLSPEEQPRFELLKHDPLIDYLTTTRKPIILDLFSGNGPLRKELDQLNMQVVLPFVFKDQLLGACFLGERNFQYRYQIEDEEILAALANQIAVAIQTALAFKEIQDLNTSLDQKVRLRTQELQKALEDLKSAQTQTVRAGKLAGIGSLAAGIAHEINNALNGTLNCAYALDRNLQAVFKKEVPFDAVADDLAESLQVIRSGMNRTRNIVEHLMRFSRKNAEGFKMDNIHDGITSTLVLLQNEIRLRNIKLDCQFGQTAEIYCNLSELNQVFFNIIKNAVDAVQHNGKISIKTWTSDGECFISIEDTGPGIDPKHIDQIFDPFFTTKSVGKGTGLGLSTSYNIVRDHGGQIEVKSEPGHGSIFTIRIPLKNYLGKAV